MDRKRDKPVFSRGQWAVQRERCRIADPRIPRAVPEPRPLGELLPDVMRHLGLEAVQWSVRLEQDWAELAGPAVAGHARPGTVRNGVLTVFVDSSVWLSELSRFGRKPLLKRLRAAYGDDAVRDVRFQLDPD